MFDLEPTTDEYHRFFLRETYKVAYLISNDPFTQVGAMLVKQFPHGRRAIGQFANRILPDVNEDDILEIVIDRERKYSLMEHAEKAAIRIARAAGEDTAGSTLYSTMVTCDPCADAAIEANIAQLVCHESGVLKTPERWHQSTKRAIEKLRSNGIRCLSYHGDIGGAVSTFNGEVWLP